MSSTAAQRLLQRIVQYEENTRKSAHQRMEVDQSDTTELLESKLDSLISQYQSKLQARRLELEQVRRLLNMEAAI